ADFTSGSFHLNVTTIVAISDHRPAGASATPTPVADCPARICACGAVVAADATAAITPVGVGIGAIGAARVSISILDLHEQTRGRLAQRKRTGQGSGGGGPRGGEGGARRRETSRERWRESDGRMLQETSWANLQCGVRPRDNAKASHRFAAAAFPGNSGNRLPGQDTITIARPIAVLRATGTLAAVFSQSVNRTVTIRIALKTNPHRILTP